MEVTVWNKTDEINGVSSDYIIKNLRVLSQDEILLFWKDNKVIEIEKVSVLRNSLKLDDTVSVLDVGNAYIEEINKENEIAAETRTENIIVELLKENIK